MFQSPDPEGRSDLFGLKHDRPTRGSRRTPPIDQVSAGLSEVDRMDRHASSIKTALLINKIVMPSVTDTQQISKSGRKSKTGKT